MEENDVKKLYTYLLLAMIWSCALFGTAGIRALADDAYVGIFDDAGIFFVVRNVCLCLFAALFSVHCFSTALNDVRYTVEFSALATVPHRV